MPKERRDKVRRHAQAAGSHALHHGLHTAAAASPPARAHESHAVADVITLDASVQSQLAAAIAASHSAQQQQQRGEQVSRAVSHQLSGHTPGTAGGPGSASGSSETGIYRQRRKKDKRSDKHSALMNSRTQPHTHTHTHTSEYGICSLSAHTGDSSLLLYLLSELLLPGERLKYERLKRTTLPSLTPLSEALPALSPLPALPALPATAALSIASSLASCRLRSSKQRAILRAAEVEQLAAVCAFEQYRVNPLSVMRAHLQRAMEPHAQQSNQAAAQKRKERRTKGQHVGAP